MSDESLSKAVENFLDQLAHLIAEHLYERLKHEQVATRMQEERKQPTRLLTVAQTAAALGISRSRVYILVAQKHIPSIRLGSTIRIPENRLQDWLAQAE